MTTISSCRICLEEDNTFSNPFISPCKCKGSMKYIHRNCLQNWRMANNTAFYECDICKYKYQFVRSTIATILRNELIILLITMITFIIISFIIGILFSPLFEKKTYKFLKYITTKILFGGIIMGFIRFIHAIPYHYYDYLSHYNYSMKAMIVIMIILGVFYVLYETYKIVQFIVNYNLSNMEYMVENVN